MKVIVAIGTCCLAFAAVAYAQAEKPSQAGRFSFAISSDGGTIWRMNNATGEASYCVTTVGARVSACGPWMK